MAKISILAKMLKTYYQNFRCYFTTYMSCFKTTSNKSRFLRQKILLRQKIFLRQKFLIWYTTFKTEFLVHLFFTSIIRDLQQMIERFCLYDSQYHFLASSILDSKFVFRHRYVDFCTFLAIFVDNEN